MQISLRCFGVAFAHCAVRVKLSSSVGPEGHCSLNTLRAYSNANASICDFLNTGCTMSFPLSDLLWHRVPSDFNKEGI